MNQNCSNCKFLMTLIENNKITNNFFCDAEKSPFYNVIDNDNIVHFCCNFWQEKKVIMLSIDQIKKITIHTEKMKKMFIEEVIKQKSIKKENSLFYEINIDNKYKFINFNYFKEIVLEARKKFIKDCKEKGVVPYLDCVPLNFVIEEFKNECR